MRGIQKPSPTNNYLTGGDPLPYTIELLDKAKVEEDKMLIEQDPFLLEEQRYLSRIQRANYRQEQVYNNHESRIVQPNL